MQALREAGAPVAAAPRARSRGASFTRRLVTLVAAIAVPLLVVNLLQIRSRMNDAEEFVLQRTEGRVQLTARVIDQYVAQMLSTLDLMESFALADAGDPQRGEERLRAIEASMHGIAARLSLFTPDGRIAASSRETARLRAEVRYEDQPWVREALASSSFVVSEPLVTQVNHRKLVIFARTLRWPDGRPRMVLVASMDLLALSRDIELRNGLPGTLVSVLSPKGRVVASSEGAQQHVTEDLSDRSAEMRGREGRGLVTFPDGTARLAAWGMARRVAWTVFIGTPPQATHAAPLRAGLLDILALLATATLGVAGALAIGGRIARPLHALQDAAHAVAQGRYQERVAEDEDGEMGALQRDFNAMVARIGEADRQREASQARLQSLLDLSTDWYWEQDESLRIVVVDGGEAGGAPFAFAGQMAPLRWELPYGGVSKDERDAHDELQRRHEPFRDFEFMRPTADGRMRWISISGRPIFDPQGAFRGYRGVGRDIDRRRRAEEAMRRSEARYRALLEASGAVLWFADARGEVVEPQPGLEKYAGAAFERYRGHGWIDALVHADDRERAREEIFGAFASGTPYSCALRIWSAAYQAWRHAVASGTAQRDAAGTVVEWVGAMTDVHDQRLAEQAYLVSEERLSAATHAAQIGVFDCDLRGARVFFSPAWKEQLGYTDAEFPNEIGEVERRMHPQDVPRVREAFEAFRAAPEGEFSLDYRMRHRDGAWRWMRARGRMFADGSGTAVRFVGASIDVSESRAREALLLDSQERLRMSLAAGRMVAWEWRMGEEAIRWGEGSEMIRGPLAGGAAAYPDFRAMVHEEDRARYLATGRAAYEGAAAYQCEFRVVWADGSVHWIKAQGAFERDAAGAPVRLVGLSQDITELVLAGERLKESEARSRAVLETTNDTVVLIDEANSITYVNPAVETQFGWKPAEVVGRPLDMLQPERLRGPHREGLRRRLAHPEAGERRHVAEVTGLARDGREIPIEIAFSGLTLGGRPYFVGFLRDIALRKRAEQEMREINAMLERHVAERTSELQAANRELESFSYTVAHDLRSPLRAIDGFSQVLEEDLGERLEASPRRYLHRIRANTKAMAQMIDELLEFSRIGRAEIAKRPVDLAPIARQVADELAIGYPQSRIDVGTLPVVEGDPTLLRVVLANLVGNALKFSGKRAQPRVSIDSGEVDGAWEIRVEDNGVGFDPQFAAKLFGVFQRLHSHDEFEGTGIGLATVARIVARHGGQVRGDSVPGEGARFRFTLPRAAPDLAQGAT